MTSSPMAGEICINLRGSSGGRFQRLNSCNSALYKVTYYVLEVISLFDIAYEEYDPNLLLIRSPSLQGGRINVATFRKSLASHPSQS